MQKYPLFPPQVTSVHVQTLTPQDWSRPYTPPAPSTTAKRRLQRTAAPRIPKRHYGSDCTMCDRKLGREMAGGEVMKPQVFKATGPDRRSLLLVLDAPDFTKSVYGLVKLIRACGFTGVIVADLAVRCGGGNIDEIKPAHATACAPHLAFTYRTLMPDIVVLSGSKSTTAFLGHTITVLSNPRSWQVIYEGEDRRAVPVMCIPSAYDISKNYIYKAEAKSSLRFVTTSAWRHEEVALEGVVKVIEADPDDEEVQGLDAFLAWAREGDWVAFDTETVGKLFARDFKVVTIAFARHDSKVVWAFHPQALQDERVRAAIRKVLKSRLLGKVGQNTKYDVHACEQEFGTRPSPVIGDTRLMYKLVNAEGAADLEAIAATVGLGAHKKEAEHAVKEAAKKLRASDERERGRKAKRHEFDAMSYAYGEIDLRVLLTYCALDTFVTAVIYERLMAVMKREHKFIWSTWTTHMLPAFNAFCTIERNGLKVDLNNVRLATDFVGGKAKEIEAQIRAAGIDPEKTASIRSYFEKHGLQSPWTTEKSGLAATDAKALKKMRVLYSEHTVISDLLAWRAANKLASSYLVSLPNFIRADGRVHASFYLDGARTGRLSAADPALHQIPSHGGPDAKMVKNCFVSERGNVLVAADYKTLEVYVNAAWSNDRNMIEALESGVDFHTNTAALIGPYAWGMSPDEVRAEIAEQLSKPDGSAPKRSMAKRTTFGVLYGMGPDSLAEDINTSRLMAASMINGFFSAFPDTSDRMRRAKAFVKQHGYIEVPRFDGVSPRRIRPLPYVGYADSYRHGKALRAATNTPIQGMASDVCTAAVVDLDLIFASDFGGEPKVLGSIHDSILVECPDSMAMEVAKTMREVMTSIRVGPLKLAVDVEYGTAWGSLKKVKFDAAKAA